MDGACGRAGRHPDAATTGEQHGASPVELAMRIFSMKLGWLWLSFVCLPALADRALALENQLARHPSPYLAMHAEDPVAWQRWSQAAVDRARNNRKLLYISIGYFSCHWCHVMQRESYRDTDIAQFLNRNFIPVKVDRELQPALDARMIEFVEATQGRGGWPLNVFVTPDGHPLYAVLYLPPERFLQVIRRIHELWVTDRNQLAALARRAAVVAEGPGRPQIDAQRVRGYAAAAEKWALTMADPLQGGFGQRNKFPSVPQLEFLLERWQRSHDQELGDFLLLTLDKMAGRGLHDHLSGGFFRYTIDRAWTTPHFEKMLYGNAQLAQLYLRAARTFGRPAFEQVARRTLDFVVTELRTSAGAFIASLSAVDDRNVEGGYYLWDREQLQQILSARELRVYTMAAGMNGPAPFDQGYLPARALPSNEIASRLQLTKAEVEYVLAGATRKLYRARSRRGLPQDTKLLAGWNGLALSSFAYAARVTGDDGYRQVARGVRDYLMHELWDGSTLRRAVSHGKPVGRAAVEDYAYVAQGLLAWAKLGGRHQDYVQARAVVREGWNRFYGPRGWRLAETSLIEAEAGQDLILDGPMPSPPAVLARTSLELAARLDDQGLRDRALSALNSGHAQLARNPFWHATQVGSMAAFVKVPRP